MLGPVSYCNVIRNVEVQKCALLADRYALKVERNGLVINETLTYLSPTAIPF